MADRVPPVFDTGPDDVASRTAAAERRRAHTRRIRFWRRALPMVIAGVAGLLVIWIGGRAVIVAVTAPSLRSDSGVRMINPQFYGRDSSNRAFVLGAAEAARDLKGGKAVTLDRPHVTLDADGVNPTQAQATQGVYREDQRKLALTGQVQVQDQRGYSFTTPQAVVDTSTGLVSGDQGVTGHGPLGQIVASSYGVYDRGERIVLKGDVHAHIVQ